MVWPPYCHRRQRGGDGPKVPAWPARFFQQSYVLAMSANRQAEPGCFAMTPTRHAASFP
jgi:hypothetical protein